MKMITLTETQVWFIKCAIEAKSAVLPLDKEVLDARIFKKDYGRTKREVESEIRNLQLKLK